MNMSGGFDERLFEGEGMGKQTDIVDVFHRPNRRDCI